MSTQFIEKDGIPEFAVIPYREYQVLVSLAEEKTDAADILAFRETQEETYPEHVIDALLNGDNPIRVFRSYRGLTQKQLAKRIEKSLPYIAKLESGERTGTIDVIKNIAEILDIGIDQLVE